MIDGRSDRSSLVIAASFAAEPLIAPLDHLAAMIGAALDPRLAAYGQILPALLDPASALRAAPARAILFRWKDVGGPTGAEALARAVEAADDGAPTFLVACPGGEGGEAATALLKARLAHRPALRIADAADVFRAYAVADAFDVRAERAADVPYREEAFAALAAEILRWRSPALRPPVKLIAVDGDMTLWDGVLGEDGSAGVRLSPGRRKLQERLAAAAGAGQVVAILSKNEDEDVVALMRRRSDFPLSLDHVLARRVNWRAKSDNLAELAAEFGVADESILFLDDNPVECAQMRARRPGVLTVMVPGADGLDGFLERLWPLDRPELTEADLKRMASLRAEAGRKAAQAAAPSLAEFFATLDLRIDVEPAGPAHLARLAQMSERTNQFNATLMRLEERDLAARLARKDAALYAVSVRDRFGDYGIVGCMGGEVREDAFKVDLFMLSCRALGRGVEHRMARELARFARERGLERLAFEHVEGPRNGPARRFLAGLAGAPLEAGAAIVETARAAAAAFDPQAAFALGADELGADGAGEGAGRPTAAAPQFDRGAGYERIALEFATGAAIVSAMRAAFRPRLELPGAFIAPAPGVERDIAAIWEEVLGVRPVGAEDPFRDLGGKSIHLVRIHGLLAERLGVEIDLASLFRFGTVALLARHLADEGGDRIAGALDRAARMRAARGAMASARRGLAKERAS